MTIPTIHAKVEMEEDTFKNIYQVASFVLEQEKRKKKYFENRLEEIKLFNW